MYPLKRIWVGTSAQRFSTRPSGNRSERRWGGTREKSEFVKNAAAVDRLDVFVFCPQMVRMLSKNGSITGTALLATSQTGTTQNHFLTNFKNRLVVLVWFYMTVYIPDIRSASRRYS